MDLLQVRDLKEQETLYDFLLYGIDDNNINYYAWLLKRYGFSYEEFIIPPYFKYSLDISSYFWSN